MKPAQELLNLLHTTFQPHAPIEDPDAFQGRLAEQKRIQEALDSPGLHVAIVGERGAGKTSLANITTIGRRTIKVFCERNYTFNDICRVILLKFGEHLAEQFEYNAEQNSIRRTGLSLRADNIGSAELLQFIPNNPPICIIVDEVDRLGRGEPTLRLGELCKQISTQRPNITLLLVGIAETAESLLAGHTSNVRNLKQVLLDRMSDGELREIIHHGEKCLDIKFGADVISQLVTISDRAPFFVHIIAKRTAQAAIERGSNLVTIDDFNVGIAGAAEDCHVELTSGYSRALASDNPNELHQQVLEALAQTESRAVPQQKVFALVDSTAIKEGKPRTTPQQVGKVLKRLASPDCGNILTRDTANLFRFTAPLMKGYVKLRMRRE